MKPYEFTGTLKKVEDAETFKGKKGEFTKRQFTVEADSDSKYPTTMYFELQNDDVDLIDAYVLGATVTVNFYIDCRSWTNPQTQKEHKFIALKAVKVVGKSARKGSAAPANIPDVPDIPDDVVTDSEDLPF